MRRFLIVAGVVLAGMALPAVAVASAFLTFGQAESVTEHVSYLGAKDLVSHGYTNVDYYRPRRRACSRIASSTIDCQALVTATSPSNYQNYGCSALIRVHKYAYPRNGHIGNWRQIGKWHCFAVSARDASTGRKPGGATAVSNLVSVLSQKGEMEGQGNIAYGTP